MFRSGQYVRVKGKDTVYRIVATYYQFFVLCPTRADGMVTEQGGKVVTAEQLEKATRPSSHEHRPDFGRVAGMRQTR